MTAEFNLNALAEHLASGNPISADERSEIILVLHRVASARKIWDGFPENYPRADSDERSHHMRGVLAHVLDRSLR